MKKIISNSPEDTQKAGKKLAIYLLKKNSVKNPPVISLEGDLGGGKTTFTQGFAMELLIKNKIKSPTFVIMKKYRIPTDNRQQNTEDRRKNSFELKVVSCKFRYLYHFDCYRIENPEEILELGWKKIIDDSKNIVLVEWGEKVEDILPNNALHIKFDFLERDKREIIFKN